MKNTALFITASIGAMALLSFSYKPVTTDEPATVKALTATEVIRSIETDMVQVDSGSFMMGTDYANFKGSTGTKVHVDNYSICRYEVTQAQWKAIMGYSNRTTNCSDCPVDSVSWEEAMQFISKLNQLSCRHYRLPTEAEWEYAKKDGNKPVHFKYSGSNTLDEVAWYGDNAAGTTHAVGKKKPNQLGLYDMNGNVAEWCADWYDRNYYTNIPANNPQGPLRGTQKVIRGGAYTSRPENIVPSLITFNNPCQRSGNCGFRLAAD